MFKSVVLCGLLAFALAEESDKKVDKRGIHGGKYFAPNVHIHDQHIKTITITKNVPVPYRVTVEKKVPVPVKVHVEKPYPVYVPRYVQQPQQEEPVQRYYEEKNESLPVEEPPRYEVRKPFPVYYEEKVSAEQEKRGPVQFQEVPQPPQEQRPPVDPQSSRSPVLFPTDEPQSQTPFRPSYPDLKPLIVPFKVYYNVPVQDLHYHGHHIPVRPEEDGHSYRNGVRSRGGHDAREGIRGLSYGAENPLPPQTTTPPPQGEESGYRSRASGEEEKSLADIAAVYSHIASSSYRDGRTAAYHTHVNHEPQQQL